MKEILFCDACKSIEFESLFNNHDRMYGIPGDFTLVQCKCGLVFLNPQPEIPELKTYYPLAYAPHSLESERGLFHKFILKLEKIYWESHLSLSKIFLFPFCRFIRGTIIRKNTSMLDIGCGEGSFLQKMKTYGMNVYGLDFSETAVSKARAKGLNVVHGDLQSQKFPDNHFDLITLHHVLEHLPNPMKTFQEIRRILKTEGTLIIDVPNIHSLGFKIFKQYWMPLETPRHLFHFSYRTLMQYANQTGFKIVRKSFQSFPSFFLESLFSFLNRNENKPMAEIFSPNSFHLLRALLLPFSLLTSWTPWGDSIEIWLKKKHH